MLDFHRRQIENKKNLSNKKIDHKEYEHRESINVMLKVIHQCDIPEHLKRIMRTRIWGVDPSIFSPMTCEQIAFANNGCKRMPTQGEIKRISDCEKSGIFYCEQFLTSCHAQEIIDKFNKNRGKNTNEMFTNTNSEKKRIVI